MADTNRVPLSEYVTGAERGAEQKAKEQAGIKSTRVPIEAYDPGSHVGPISGVEWQNSPSKGELVTNRLVEDFGGLFKPNQNTVESSTDLMAAGHVGKYESIEKRNSIWQMYYPDGELKYREFEEGDAWVVTKDKNAEHPEWTELSMIASDLPAALVSGATAGAVLGGLGGGIGGAVRGTLATFAGSLAENTYLSTQEDNRSNPLWNATMDAAFHVGGEALAAGLLPGMIRKHLGAKFNKGTQDAYQAALDEGLQPILGGQATTGIGKNMYLQHMNLYDEARDDALRRFESLDVDGLNKWLKGVEGKGGLSFDGASQAELNAMAERAGQFIEKDIRGIISGDIEYAAGARHLDKALNLFNRASSTRRDELYQRAFDVALSDGVEFNVSGLKNLAEELAKGVKIKGKVKDLYSLDEAQLIRMIGEIDPTLRIPTTKEEQIRLLTPNAELNGIMDVIDRMDNINTATSDGPNLISSMQQMNAIRRSLSEIAWSEKGNNQGRMATQLLNKWEDTVANPVSGKDSNYMEIFEEAKNSHELWKSVKDIRNIAQLERASVGEQVSIMRNITKPGNGRLISLLKEMTKDSPQHWNNFKNSFVADLLNNPTSARNLDKFKEMGDTAGLRKIISEGEENTIREFGRQEKLLQESPFFRMKEQGDLNLANKAEELASSENLDELKFMMDHASPKTRESVKAGFIQKLRDSSLTEPHPDLGVPLINSKTFIKEVGALRKMFGDGKGKNLVFSEADWARLTNFENYAIKIGDTAQDVGASLQKGEQAAKGVRAIEIGIKKGPTGAIASFYLPFASSKVMSEMILGFTKPITRIPKDHSGATKLLYKAMKLTPVVVSQLIQGEDPNKAIKLAQELKGVSKAEGGPNAPVEMNK